MQKIYLQSYFKLLAPKHFFTWIGFGCAWIVGQLPHKITIILGKIFALLLTPFFSKRIYIIRTNLATCFPHLNNQEIYQLSKQNFQNLVIGAFETAKAWYGSKSSMRRLENKFHIENEHILQEYLSKTQPLLLIALHCTSQELVSRYLVNKYQYIPVFRHLNNPVANFLMQKARLRIYNQAILKSNPRQIIRAIKSQHKPVGILPDQDFGRKRSVFAPFFDVLTATTTSLSKYKKLTNCNILAISYQRKFDTITGKFEKFIISIHPELNITGEDLEQDALELNRTLENIIKKDITAYFWIAKKFKTRPKDEKPIYNYKKKKLFSTVKS